jgi:hypothetical protein
VSYRDYRNERQVATVEQFLEMAMWEPFFPWQYEVASAVLNQEARPGGVSVTQTLFTCLRCEVLKKYEPYTLDIDSAYPALRGTAFHGVLEKHSRPGAIVEVRFWSRLPGGGEVHGQPDTLHMLNKQGTEWVLKDWKTTREVPRWDKPWGHHVEQVQTYRWLVNHADRWDQELAVDPRQLNITRLGIVYLDDKTSKPLEVRKSLQVATTTAGARPTKTIKVPHIWTDEEVEAVLVPRYWQVVEATEHYEKDRTLPPYPPGFDYLRTWIHRYSPVAEMCVDRYVNDNRVA